MSDFYHRDLSELEQFLSEIDFENLSDVEKELVLEELAQGEPEDLNSFLRSCNELAYMDEDYEDLNDIREGLASHFDRIQDSRKKSLVEKLEYAFNYKMPVYRFAAVMIVMVAFLGSLNQSVQIIPVGNKTDTVYVKMAADLPLIENKVEAGHKVDSASMSALVTAGVDSVFRYINTAAAGNDSVIYRIGEMLMSNILERYDATGYIKSENGAVFIRKDSLAM